MSVIFAKQTETFEAEDIALSNTRFEKAFVRYILVSQTEAVVDMLIDGDRNQTRQELQDSLRGVPIGAEDYVDDLLADVVAGIKRRLETALYGAAVTGVKYDLAGDIKDIEVDVSIGWE